MLLRPFGKSPQWFHVSLSARPSLHTLDGSRIGDYQLNFNGAGTALTLDLVSANVWFGGKLLREGDWNVVQDAKGSVRWRQLAGSPYTVEKADYYPFGQEKPSATAQGRQKFGTYLRDEVTGLDYADQRYFSSTVGRFMTADPYKASGGPGDPGSWNRYSYVEGDPVNLYDPAGLFQCVPGVTCAPPPPPPYVPDPLPIGVKPDSLPAPDTSPLAMASQGYELAAQAAVDMLKNEKCASLFGIKPGSPNPADVLSGNGRFSKLVTWLIDGTSEDTAAQTYGNGGFHYEQMLDDDGLPIESWKIYDSVTVQIFTNGKFSALGYGAFSGASPDLLTPLIQDAGATILHELGHAFQLLFGADTTEIATEIGSDGRFNPDISKANAALVRERCQ